MKMETKIVLTNTVVGMVIGLIIAFGIFGVTGFFEIGQAQSMGYYKGFQDCNSNVATYLNNINEQMVQAQAIVNKCADLSNIVIDERDACQKELLDLNGCLKVVKQ